MRRGVKTMSRPLPPVDTTRSRKYSSPNFLKTSELPDVGSAAAPAIVIATATCRPSSLTIDAIAGSATPASPRSCRPAAPSDRP